MYVCDRAKVCFAQTRQIIGLKHATYQQTSNNFKNEMKSLTEKRNGLQKAQGPQKLTS